MIFVSLLCSAIAALLPPPPPPRDPVRGFSVAIAILIELSLRFARPSEKTLV